MSVKQIARIAIMAAMMAVVFTMFSQVLYLEAITLTIAVLALTCERPEVF